MLPKVLLFYPYNLGMVFYTPLANMLSLFLIRIGLTVLGVILKEAAEYGIFISITNS